jgi:diaminopimelate decarboxylase
VAELAGTLGTPLYLYSAQTIRRRIAELRAALASTKAPFRLYYAVKANRFRPILDLIRREGDVGIDTSSPREVALALASGFKAEEISVTVSMPSNRDLADFAMAGVHLNLDTESALRRYAALSKGLRCIGLRVDPGIALGYGSNKKLSYSNSKFGFDLSRVTTVAALAKSLGLTVDTVHVHAGWGLQQSVHDGFEQVLKSVVKVARAIPTITTINVGGGLCWRQVASDQPLALSSWAELLQQHLTPLGVTIAVESGTYVVASGGLLLAEVNTVERRMGQPWLGIDAGHNTNVYAAHYNIPQEIIHATKPLDAPTVHYTVAGNINEANDIFAPAAPLPQVEEGDYVAFFPAGAYGASMASDHCLKGLPREHLIEESEDALEAYRGLAARRE